MTETTQAVEPQNPETEAQAAPAVEPVGADGKPFDPERAQALIDKLRAEAKDAKANAKELARLQAEEQKRKEAEMTELEKLSAHAAELEKKVQAQEHREMQRAAAAKFKLPEELVSRLVGSTPEEMEADAKQLAEALPKTPKLNPTNPPAGGLTETREQKRQRLLGNNADVFTGGGVMWGEKIS